jgi:hypothetical protein
VSPVTTTEHQRTRTQSAGTPVLTISRTHVARLLVGAVVLLHALNIPAIIVRYLVDVPGSTGYPAVFSVSNEGKLPTFYSGLTLLVAALLLAAIATHEHKNQGRFARHWFGLSVIFVFMAADELLEIHELSMGPMRRVFGITGGPLFFAWVIPAAALLVLLAITYKRFLAALPRPSLRAFLIAGFVYVGGALGMELVGSAYFTTHSNDVIYGVIATIEEMGEMTGMALFILALLDHLVRIAPDWRIELRQ